MQTLFKKIRVGIVGCGKIFSAHQSAITKNSDRFVLVAVCDNDTQKLKNLTLDSDVLRFDDYQTMIDKMAGKIDLITIATPNSYHKEQAITALNQCYDVLIEKPVAFTHNEVQQIEKAANSNNRKVNCVFQVRYNSSIDLLRRILKSRLLGQVRSLSLVQRWQRPMSYFDDWRGDINIGGRTLYEIGIHYLDIMRWIFNQPEVIYTKTYKLKHKQVAFEDTVYSVMTFPGGVAGSIEITIAAEPSNIECSLTVMAENGIIKLGGKSLNTIELFDIFDKNDEYFGFKKEISQVNEPVLNDYGIYKGSSSNHPLLYKALADNQGIGLIEAAQTISFIESIYEKST